VASRALLYGRSRRCGCGIFTDRGWGAGNEVLINDRRVPYARELWLPMVWLLIR
jgi:hypothetical protein